jgi:hypothetical protein
MERDCNDDSCSTPITLEEFLRRPDRDDGQREELIEG